MTPTPDPVGPLAEARARHRPPAPQTEPLRLGAPLPGYCLGCGDPWPCLVARLADAHEEALRVALRAQERWNADACRLTAWETFRDATWAKIGWLLAGTDGPERLTRLDAANQLIGLIDTHAPDAPEPADEDEDEPDPAIKAAVWAAIERTEQPTPNRQRATHVIAAWLAGEDLTGVEDGHRRAAEHLLGRIEDAGLMVVSDADDGPP